MAAFAKLGIVVSAAALCAGVSAQPAAKHSFEVASIKPSDPNAHGSSSNSDRRLMTMRNWTLKRLIARAYEVQEYQITGGPNWLDTDHFDISAKVDESEPELKGPEGAVRMRAMMSSLIGERFQCQLRKETKTLPVYNLVVAKSGFKGSPVDSHDSHSLQSRNNQLTAKGVSVAGLVVFLSGIMERPVLDATGIPGDFDFQIEWSQQDSAAKAPEGNEPARPSIFTALQEQLGLKLESTKGPVEIIVVDHAEKPTEN